MKQKLLLGILSACTLLNVGCDLIEDEYHHYYIGVENRSDSTIYVTMALDWYDDEYRDYPRWFNEDSVEAGDCELFMADDGPHYDADIWENCFRWDDSLTVTIYDTIPSRWRHFYYHCYYEQEEIPYVMRYLLTRDNLRKLGWRIPYPPSAEMSKMTIIKPEEQ